MILTLLLSAAMQANAFTLVKNGKAKAEIDLPLDSTPAAKRAAQILQSSVFKMSGATLPILEKAAPASASVAIDYGTIKPTAELSTKLIKPDGYAIWASDGGLTVESGGGKGAIYGVVQVLEQYFGCRCYSPAAWLFPKSKNLTLPDFQESDNPTFEFRVVNGDFSNDPDYLDWQRLNRVDERFGNGYYVHTSAKLVPPDQYFKDHPEYFALIDGKRSTNQICPSAEANVGIVVGNLQKVMAQQPDKQVWSVSQNDNPYYCQCPLCAKTDGEEGSPAGAYIRFVNEVAAHFPEKTIATLAYQFSRHAPKLTKPASNVLIMLCSIELNRSKAISGDPTSQDFVKDLDDWSNLTHDLYVWDYTVDFAHMVSPFPNLFVLQPNLKLFHQMGVKQMFEQTNTAAGHEFSELKSYLLAHLMWNPDADLEKLESDFLDGYYGAAGRDLYGYIKRQELALQHSGQRLDIYGPPTNYENGFLSQENIETYNQLFNEAEQSVKNNPVLLDRVKVARLPLRYAILQIGWANVFGPRGFFERANDRVVLKPFMMQTLEAFHETCRKNNVRTLNESGLTPEDYYQAIKRMLDLQIAGNYAFGATVTASPNPSAKYSNGDLANLTNGVRGGNDYTVQWIGWEGADFDLSVDLGKATNSHEADIDTLSNQRSWILHPVSVSCSVSSDGTNFTPVGTEMTNDDQQHEPLIHTYSFHWSKPSVRYLRFQVKGTKTLPPWHASPGGKSWVFVDQIVVR